MNYESKLEEVGLLLVCNEIDNSCTNCYPITYICGHDSRFYKNFALEWASLNDINNKSHLKQYYSQTLDYLQSYHSHLDAYLWDWYEGKEDLSQTRPLYWELLKTKSFWLEETIKEYQKFIQEL